MALISLSGLGDVGGFRIDDTIPGDQAGSAVAQIGDVNADGIGDVAIGLPGANNGKGAVYVLYGSADPAAVPLSLEGLAPAQGYRLDGAAAGGRLGAALAAAGDVNGDGIADYLVGAPGANTTYLVYGRPGPGGDRIDLGASSAAAVRIFGTTGTGFGTAVAAIDLNQDGVRDIVIGAPAAGGAAGAAHVVLGKAGGLAQSVYIAALAATQLLRLDGGATAGLAGSALTVGDVDGDGRADLLIGAPGAAGGQGAVYVVRAQAGGFTVTDLPALAAARVEGAAGERIGGTLAAADLNGDGIGDIAIGRAGAAGLPGTVQVVFGKAGGIGEVALAGLAATERVRLAGLPGAPGGWAVGGGDVDGDGIADLLVGGAGGAWVLYGGPGLGGGIDLAALAAVQGIQLGNGLGGAVALGDVNADGHADLLFGDGTANANGGAATLVYGFGPAGWTGTAAAETRLGDAAGNLLAGLGGDDSLAGNAGPDTLLGGDGADTLRGGYGDDRLDGGAADGAGGDDSLSGGPGDDTLLAGPGQDTLDGGAGADRLVGGAGTTVFLVDDPGDVVVPGAAPPTANLVRSTISFALPAGAAGLTLLGMEAIDGTGNPQGADSITGNDAANQLAGLGGEDWLAGLGGADTLLGGAGADTLLGGPGGDLLEGAADADALEGGAGEDTLLGGAGADTLRGGAGDDLLEGGAGADLAVFGLARAGVTLARQVDGSWQVSSAEGTDRLIGIERLQFTDQTIGLTAAPKDFAGAGTSSLLFRETGGTVMGAVLAGLTLLDTPLIASPGAAWKVAGTGDFNGDGMADILWRHDDGSLSIWHMQASGFLGGGGMGNPGTAWTVAGVGDMNGDGMADILWRHGSGALAAWFMDGTDVIGGGTIASVGTDWQVAGMGDFNADGRADILWRQDGTGELAMWLMDGTAYIGGGGVAKVGAEWRVAGIGDFNGDLRSDILWLRDGDGTAAEWWMNGTAGIGGGTIGRFGPYWKVADIGDYDGDGRSDLAWREAGGATVLWRMNGLAALETADLGNPGSNWALV